MKIIQSMLQKWVNVPENIFEITRMTEVYAHKSMIFPEKVKKCFFSI